MGIRITSSEGVHALFDSVTGWAFGPVFDSEEALEDFLSWATTHVDGDLRNKTNTRLEELVGEWRATFPALEEEPPACGRIRPGTLSYQRCVKTKGHLDRVHRSQDAGEWEPEPEPIPDLMAALEESLARAKALIDQRHEGGDRASEVSE